MGLGDNIKIFRLMNGMTQDELAKKVGYKSKTTIAKIESGVNSIPLAKINQFADALNTSPAVLMGEEDSVHHVMNEQFKRWTDTREEDPRLKRLYEFWSALTELGRDKLLDYAEDIQDKYKKGEDIAEEVQ